MEDVVEGRDGGLATMYETRDPTKYNNDFGSFSV